MSYQFFAAMSRMKYIERWSLMRNSRAESLCEHSMETAVIAHALALIANERFGKDLDANRAAVLGLYHDAPEIITGDLPTPVKYFNEQIRDSYKDVELAASNRLLDTLPKDLQDEYDRILKGADEDPYLMKLLKGADKISALIKCIEEEKSGNSEFKSAKQTVLTAIEKLSEELPEVKVFMEEFLPPFGQTLDELLF